MLLPPLTQGKLLKRYKRFLADVKLPDGQVVTAHCPNTGSMQGCWRPDAPVEISYSDNPKRKLAWTLERVDMGGGWIGVHTGRTNPVVAEALAAGSIPELSGYARIQKEVRFDSGAKPHSRFDFFLSEGAKPDAWIEVKNVTLLDGGRLKFPDAVTERGRKHLEALAAACQLGCRGVMLYALNRPEGERFAPAEEIDPKYAETLRRVVEECGVEVMAYRIEHIADSMRLTDAVPIDLDQ